jgi:hypothetical protein
MAIPRFLLVLALALPALAQGGPTQPAEDAAITWLALADAGKYGESWDAASPLLKSALTRQAWDAALRPVRGPLGALQARKLKSAQATQTLPGAPDGAYVVLQFDTRFESKAAAVETVIPRREPDGSWKVAGYFIK